MITPTALHLPNGQTVREGDVLCTAKGLLKFVGVRADYPSEEQSRLVSVLLFHHLPTCQQIIIRTMDEVLALLPTSIPHPITPYFIKGGVYWSELEGWVEYAGAKRYNEPTFYRLSTQGSSDDGVITIPIQELHQHFNHIPQNASITSAERTPPSES